MRLGAAFLSACFILSAIPLAEAGPAVDAATRAEALIAEGKPLEAIDAIGEVVDALCRASPLLFRNARLVEGEAGAYSLRPDEPFRPDDKMMIHVEPACFGDGGSEEAPTIELTADLAIENAGGQVLAEQKGLFKFSAPVRQSAHDAAVTLALAVPFIRPGDYKAVVTVHDQNSQKSGSFEVPFTVVLPNGAAGAAN
jgi:hypothetical protein